MDYDELLVSLSDADAVRVGDKVTKELIAVKLVPTFDLYKTKPRSLVDGSKQHKYLLNEFVWYLNGERDIKHIKKYSKFWKAISSNGLANSNYGYLTLYEYVHRVKDKDLSPAQWCVHALKKDKNTRQAVMLYNKPNYVTDTKDFICTQTQQFLLREALHSIVTIRSSDAIRGLSFDIPWWRFITNVIANTIGARPGHLVVDIGSSHVYEEHFRLLEDMLYSDWTKYRIHTDLTLDDIYAAKQKWTETSVANSIFIEEYDDSDLR